MRTTAGGITRALAAALALGLAGCSGMGYAIQNYSGVKVEKHVTSEGVFRIFDKPEEGRLMITESLGAAFRHGWAEGSTLGIANPNWPTEDMQRFAQSWLDISGRKCKITSGRLIIMPQWEFFYECE